MDPAVEVTWREVQTILDEELQRLPERYRAPVILCYLECLTRDEAAQQLRLPPTTLHSRLVRARDLLRERLTKRGLTLPAVLTAAVLGESIAQAALSPTFVVCSTKAAMLLAAGQPLTEVVVMNHVLALTQEVLKTMFLTKLKLGTGAVLCASLFAALIGGSMSSLVARDGMPGLAKMPTAQEPVKAPPKQKEPVKPKDGPLGMKFAPLPKGTFYMGWDGDKKGVKTKIKEDFEIAVDAVTQEQWEKVMGKNPSEFSREGTGKEKVKDIMDEELKQFPVENVSWEEVQEFIKKLNENEVQGGYVYRLPSECGMGICLSRRGHF